MILDQSSMLESNAAHTYIQRDLYAHQGNPEAFLIIYSFAITRH